jgi:hypothetical protein
MVKRKWHHCQHLKSPIVLESRRLLHANGPVPVGLSITFSTFGAILDLSAVQSLLLDKNILMPLLLRELREMMIEA